MTPEGALLLQAQQALGVIAVLMVIVAFCLATLRIDECLECPHCQNKKRDKKRKEDAARKRWERKWYGRELDDNDPDKHNKPGRFG